MQRASGGFLPILLALLIIALTCAAAAVAAAVVVRFVLLVARLGLESVGVVFVHCCCAKCAVDKRLGELKLFLNSVEVELADRLGPFFE